MMQKSHRVRYAGGEVRYVLPLLAAIAWAMASATGGEVRGWRLVFEDDFSGSEVDTNRWRVEDVAPNKNNELEYYAPDDVFTSNGCLVLRSRKRAIGGREYSSGLVDTRGRWEQAFGRFEIRARLPVGQGIWPAHWLLPASGQWPPEIDIMELLGHDPHTVYMTVHWGHWPEVRSDADIFKGPHFGEDFHTFMVEWLPEKITWYVDSEKRFESSEYVPQVPMYLIINTAVGGDWPGEPDDTTPFPVYHYVDRVRIYLPEETSRSYLQVGARNGWIEVQPYRFVFKPEEKVQLRAVPEIGYQFCGWSGDLAGVENPVTLLMSSNRVIRAVFAKDPEGPELLSLDAKVQVSSVEAAGLEGSKAVDGDLRTRWSSEFADPQWIILDLGQVCRITDIKLVWERAHARHYELAVSPDSKRWATIKKVRNSRGGTERFRNLSVPARFLRLRGISRATEWGYSLWEISVYGRRLHRTE